MRLTLSLLTLLLLCAIPSAQLQDAPEFITLKIAVIPAPSARPELPPGVAEVYVFSEDTWKIIEVGKTTYGVFPLEGYPNGVCVRVSVSKWTR